jgi:hypothetical protein
MSEVVDMKNESRLALAKKRLTEAGRGQTKAASAAGKRKRNSSDSNASKSEEQVIPALIYFNGTGPNTRFSSLQVACNPISVNLRAPRVNQH